MVDINQDIEIPKEQYYKSNPNLKRAFSKHAYTAEQIMEYVKCSKDCQYFVEHYLKIIHVDRGLVPLEMYPFQKDLLNTMVNNRYVIAKIGRQSGKSTITCSYILWEAIFKHNQTLCILANKAATAREILGRCAVMFEHLPNWLQSGVLSYNKGSIELENGSRIIAGSTTSSAVRGLSINTLVIDEAAFIPHNMFDDFFTSVFPTISSGDKTKLIMISTPNGLNHFYKIWVDAENGRNAYTKFEADWKAVPGRDEKWAIEQRKMLGDSKFSQEMECSFLGSADTLIETKVLSQMPWFEPITNEKELKIYEETKPNNNYIISVDCSEGINQDYSVISIIDITKIPYKVVALYRNNRIDHVLLPSVLYSIGRKYNDASVLVENNGIGLSVVNSLHNDLEYENIWMTESDRSGQTATLSYNSSCKLGVKTSSQTKRIGCTYLKSLIERQKLIIPSFEIISELTSFVVNGNSYAAEEGSNDDTVMTLVNFAWLTTQLSFINLVNNISKNITEEFSTNYMPFETIFNKDEEIREWLLNDERYKVSFEGSKILNNYFNKDNLITIEESNKFFNDFCYTINTDNNEEED